VERRSTCVQITAIFALVVLHAIGFPELDPILAGVLYAFHSMTFSAQK